MSVQQHGNAWRVPSAEDGVYGIVVQVDGRPRPYWWVLCPAAATLILDDRPPYYDDCSLGIECDFPEVHAEARRLIHRLDSLVPDDRRSPHECCMACDPWDHHEHPGQAPPVPAQKCSPQT